jgi:hypothetical protein
MAGRAFLFLGNKGFLGEKYVGANQQSREYLINFKDNNPDRCMLPMKSCYSARTTTLFMTDFMTEWPDSCRNGLFFFLPWSIRI